MSLLRALERHWFAPARTSDLAVARMLIVGSQLIVFLPSLEGQYWLAGIDAELFRPIPALKVMMLPFGDWGARPDFMVVRFVWLLAVVSGITGFLGLHTRPSLLAFAAANTFMVAHEYSYSEFHHPEGLMVIALWLLALSPSGRVFSLDDLRTRTAASLQFMKFQPRRPTAEYSDMARWPLRTSQWLFVLVYLSASLSKLLKGGLEWMNGHTLGLYFLMDAVRWDLPWVIPLAEQTWIMVVMSIAAVAFETTFFAAILFPRVTWPYLLLGAAFHTGIYVTQRAPFFQFIVLYIVFLETLRLHVPFKHLLERRASRKHWTVVYDGLCPRCIRTMVLLDYADCTGRVAALDLETEWPRAGSTLPRISQDDARHAMHVVSPEGEIHRGYFAFRALARALPALWPVYPLFVLPFASQVGPWIYDRMAARRTRVCTVDTCGRAALVSREPTAGLAAPASVVGG